MISHGMCSDITMVICDVSTESLLHCHCNHVTIMMSLLQDAEEFGAHHIWLKMLHPLTGLKLQSHHYQLMHYPDTLTAREITDWLVKNRHASSRSV